MKDLTKIFNVINLYTISLTRDLKENRQDRVGHASCDASELSRLYNELAHEILEK